MKQIYKAIMTAVLIIASVVLNAQNLSWVRVTPGLTCEDVSVNGSGDVLTTGYFGGVCDFDPSTAVFNLTGSFYDIYVSKFNSFGQFQWAIDIGSTGDERATAVCSDPSGNIYVTGYFQGTCDFDPGAGITSLTSSAFTDVFLLKLNSTGQFLWVKQFSGNAFMNADDVVCDISGNVFLCARFQGIADLDPTAAVASYTSQGAYDLFVEKFDPSGNLLFTAVTGSPNNDRITEAVVNSNLEIILTGYFQGTADFDPGVGVTNLTASAPHTDVFVWKLSATGNYMWAGKFGGSDGPDEAYGIDLDASGNIYLTGFHYGNADFDPGVGTAILASNGTYDSFVCKLSSAGNFSWAKSTGGAQDDMALSVGVRTTGEVLVLGKFRDNVDFDPGAGITQRSSAGASDFYLQHFDNNGNFQFVNTFGSNGDETFIEGANMSFTNEFFIFGRFPQAMDFDPSANTYTQNSSGLDHFLMNYSDCAQTYSTQTITECNNYTWGNTTYTNSGVYYRNDMSNAGGCDSIMVLNLTINNDISFNQSPTVCSGQTFTVGNSVYNTSGNYTDTLLRANGCDSLVYTNLTVNPPVTSNQAFQICNGQSVTVGSNVYSQTGTYMDTVTTVNGCDSVIVTNLTVLPSNDFSQTVQLCAGQTLTVGNNMYSQTGNYMDTLIGANGCDSVITTNLTVDAPVNVATNTSQFTITSQASNATYQWIDCNTNTIIAGATAQTFTATADGDYAVIVTVNGCSDTSACVNITGIGITEIFASQIQIYPNPSNGNFTVNCPAEKINYSICNSLGQEILSGVNTAATFQVNLSHLPNGVYYLRLANANSQTHIALIKNQ
jgi:hypothetical protein